ncbi:hypothetical protein EV361DRAFT_757172, partial [Lentinula raphanica]
MVYRHISTDLKQRAIQLLDNDYPVNEVAEVLGVSARSLYRWTENLDNLGSIIIPSSHRRGRPSTVQPQVVHDLVALAAEAPEMYLKEIQDWLAIAHDIELAPSSICRLIKDAGITYKRLRRAAAERDDDLRAKWMADVAAHYVASQM